jgi:SAM-dependent methyltransferase
MTGSWLNFWDRPHSIYVNERHLRLHYRRIADDILSVLPARDDLAVLDFGCGEALEADRVARRARTLYLFDGAASVRDHVRARFPGVPNIDVRDEIATLPDGSIDVVVVFSVVQYVERAALPGLIGEWRRLLRAGGLLVIADSIPPAVRMSDDIKSLLHTAWQGGFLMAALRGLATTFFSDYRRLRHELGFSVYNDEQMLGLLRAAGLRAEIHPRNLGFHPRRRTYLARPV